MLFSSKPLFIIPLVIFFLGISYIPMADSVLRPEIHRDVILTEKDDMFDFKPEKQVELTIEEEKEKFCFLFWCW